MRTTEAQNHSGDLPHLGQHPPRPRLVLRIGVTGHRPNRIGQEGAPCLAETIRVVLGELEDELVALHADYSAAYTEAEPVLRVISPVAEGADRLAAEAALSGGHELQIVLPFPRDRYERDFGDSASVAAFRRLLDSATAVFELPQEGDDAESAGRAYEAVGIFTLRQCDLLLAVWDGREARGRGGTADVVARAVQSGIPVVWLDSNGKREPRLIWPQIDGPMPAELDVESLPSEALAARRRDVIRTLLAPPSPESDAYRRLQRFYEEPIRRWQLRLAYPLLQCLTLVRGLRWTDLRPPFGSEAAYAAWKAYWDQLPDRAKGDPERIATVLLPRFFWADSLATRYAQTFRSGYVANFFLSAVAVAMALMGLLAYELKPWWVLIELVLIGLILLNTLFGISARWHERWLDYRHLAEALRHLRFLALTGSSVKGAGLRTRGDTPKEAFWIEWYTAATLRELGLPRGRADEAYVEATCAILRDVELAEQAAYHERAGHVLHRLDHRLHNAGILVFSGTAAVCLAFLVINAIDHDRAVRWASWATFLTALLPAIGAALYGIRVQGDFEGVAERSRDMAQRLEAIRHMLRTRPLTFAALSQIAEQAADTMLAEVTVWRLVFRTRPLDLPA